MLLKANMTETEMEAYLIENEYDVFTHDNELVVDSTKIIDIAIGFGYESKMDNNGIINFVMREPKYCRRCDSLVFIENDIDDYPYYCPDCDENMFNFEVVSK